jgi:hypothetical protein
VRPLLGHGDAFDFELELITLLEEVNASVEGEQEL